MLVEEGEAIPSPVLIWPCSSLSFSIYQLKGEDAEDQQKGRAMGWEEPEPLSHSLDGNSYREPQIRNLVLTPNPETLGNVMRQVACPSGLTLSSCKVQQDQDLVTSVTPESHTQHRVPHLSAAQCTFGG